MWCGEVGWGVGRVGHGCLLFLATGVCWFMVLTSYLLRALSQEIIFRNSLLKRPGCTLLVRSLHPPPCGQWFRRIAAISGLTAASAAGQQVAEVLLVALHPGGGKAAVPSHGDGSQQFTVDDLEGSHAVLEGLEAPLHACWCGHSTSRWWWPCI